jgi:hypothetical protein
MLPSEPLAQMVPIAACGRSRGAASGAGDRAQQHDLAADDPGHRRHDGGRDRGLDRQPALEAVGPDVHRLEEVAATPDRSTSDAINMNIGTDTRTYCS